MDEEEAFLSRWSRRKLEAKRDAPAALPAVEPETTVPAAPDAAAMRAPAADAQPDRGPEYREFFDPRVHEKLRRAALKKLFGEPQFNVMDGLDTYIDDYSQPDPIPEAMLRRLNQAQDLLLFEERKTADGAIGAGADAAASAPAEAASMGAAPALAAAESAPEDAVDPLVSSNDKNDVGRQNH